MVSNLANTAAMQTELRDLQSCDPSSDSESARSASQNPSLMMGWRPILHENEVIKSRPGLDDRQKPLLKQFQLGDRRDVVVEKDGTYDTLTTNSGPYADSERMKRLFAIPARIFVAPVPEVLMIHVSVNMKMCLVRKKNTAEEVLRQVQLRSSESNTCFKIHWP